MKTITMDYEEYQTELMKERHKGESEMRSKFDEMLRSTYGTTVQQLEERFVEVRQRLAKDDYIFGKPIKG